MKVGDEFSSFQDVQEAIKRFEETMGITFYIRTSRTIEAARKKCPAKCSKANENLIYYDLKYNCYKGGQPRQVKKNKTRKTSTAKENCPAYIRFCLSDDGSSFKVRQIMLDHNHQVDKTKSAYLPKNRRLYGQEKEEVQRMLQFGGNKHLVKNYILKKFGKKVTIKDLSNLKSILKFNEEIGNCELEKAIHVIKQDDPLSIIEIFVDEETNVIEGCFYQNSDMQNFYQKYPEYLLCDTTYTLNNLKMQLYILMVIDGSGHNHPVATFLLENENTASITHMVDVFKKYNPIWTETSLIVNDKDFKEINVFKESFPSARTVLTLFNVLKTFRMNITCEKMSIRSKERDICLQVLQKMAFATSETVYFTFYDVLEKLNLPKVKLHFDQNWHPFREEWVQGIKRYDDVFGIWRTEHLENFNEMVNQVIKQLNSPLQFFHDFIIALRIKNEEWKMEISNMHTKISSREYPENSPEWSYLKFITPYAFSFIKHNIELSTKCRTSKLGKQFHVHLLNKVTICDNNKCECSFWKYMKLPCPHIFAVLLYLKEPLFKQELVHYRYRLSHYTEIQKLTPNNDSTALCTDNRMLNETKNEQQHYEKFITSMEIFQKIAIDLADYETSKFMDNLEKLKTLSNLIHERKSYLITKEVCDETVSIEQVDTTSEEDPTVLEFEFDEKGLLITNFKTEALNSTDPSIIVFDQIGSLITNIKTEESTGTDPTVIEFELQSDFTAKFDHNYSAFIGSEIDVPSCLALNVTSGDVGSSSDILIARDTTASTETALNIMKVGDEFASLRDMKEAIRKLQKATGTKFYILTSRTIEGARKKCPAKSSKANINLVYYELKYSCCKGGRPQKQMRDKSRKTFTPKQNCPAFIRICLSDDGSSLKVKNLMLNHNHQIEKSIFPNRQLHHEEKEIQWLCDRKKKFQYTKNSLKNHIVKKYKKLSCSET